MLIHRDKERNQKTTNKNQLFNSPARIEYFLFPQGIYPLNIFFMNMSISSLENRVTNVICLDLNFLLMIVSLCP
jgi:hypothetical protein